MAQHSDFIVIGAGIAGVSVGYELAKRGKVVVLEREAAPGYHATGRSAAAFAASYGALQARRLTAASRAFFDCPPDGFCDHALLAPRGVLFICLKGEEARLEDLASAMRAAGGTGEAVGASDAPQLVPVLRPERIGGGMLDRASMDIDVHGLHSGYISALRRAGGELVLDAEVAFLAPAGAGWRVETRKGAFEAPVVVNAAGAWADELARLAGVTPAGLSPKRRTALTFDPPDGLDPAAWPMVVEAGETVYFKPDAGRILVSPANEDDSPPCDAQPEELDIAIAMDRLQQLTTLAPQRIAAKWAGLRTFAADRLPVVGFDGRHEGFFWFAGQGGTGIQMAPALAKLGAALATGDSLPKELGDLGFAADELSPSRAALSRGPAGRA